MVMNEIAKFLLISVTQLLFINFIVTHINATITNRINGKIDNKNSLNIEFDSNAPLISASEIKQSNDKNVWFGSPTLVAGLSERIKLSGSLSSNESDAVTNCK